MARSMCLLFHVRAHTNTLPPSCQFYFSEFGFLSCPVLMNRVRLTLLALSEEGKSEGLLKGEPASFMDEQVLLSRFQVSFLFRTTIQP